MNTKMHLTFYCLHKSEDKPNKRQQELIQNIQVVDPNELKNIYPKLY